MIFQIDYQSGGLYDSYFEANKPIITSLDHKVFGDSEIDTFLIDYGYYDLFHSKKVADVHMYAEKPIKCALLRLMILYELGGVYVDADVTFTDEVVSLEKDLNKYGNRNVVLSNRSLYFIKGVSKSKFIKYMMDLYLNSDYMVTDTVMNKKHELSMFHKELMIIPPDSLSKYFLHSFTHNMQ